MNFIVLIFAEFLIDGMKPFLKAVMIAAVSAAVYFVSAALPPETFCGLQKSVSVCDCQGVTDSHSQANFSEFHGFIAHNALRGTSEKIQTPDRQIFLYRNSSGGWSGYNPGNTKRQTQSTCRLPFDSGITHSSRARYFLLAHNSNMLDGGMSSNSERIHILHILII